MATIVANTGISQKESYDAFSRLRVSQDTTIFESKLLYDTEPLYWDQQTLTPTGAVVLPRIQPILASSGKLTLEIASTLLANLPTTASAAQNYRTVRQTYQRFGHQSGKSTLIFLSGTLCPSISNVDGTSRIGLFDDNDGIFIEAVISYTTPPTAAVTYPITATPTPSNPLFSIVKRSLIGSTVTEVKIYPDKWYIKNSASDKSLFDPLKMHTFYISYQSAGSQDITFGMLVGGRMIPLYTFFNDYTTSSTTGNPPGINPAYITTDPFSTPNLPIRYEVVAEQNVTTGTTTIVVFPPSITCMGVSVLSEGGNDLNGFTYMIDRNSSHLTISQINTIYPALICKLQASSKSTNIFFDNLEILSSSQDVLYKWYIYANPVISLASHIALSAAAALNQLTITPSLTPPTAIPPYTPINRIDYNYTLGNNDSTTSSVSIATTVNAPLTTTTTTVITNTVVKYMDELLFNGGIVLLSGFSKGSANIDLRNTNASKYSLGFSIDGTANVLGVGIEIITPTISPPTNFNVNLIVRETM